MKPRIQRWRPTTCDCEVLEYIDENGDISFVTESEAQTRHQSIFNQYPNDTVSPSKQPQKPIKVCQHHTVLGATGSLYDTMNDECKRVAGVTRLLLGIDSNVATKAISDRVAELKQEGEDASLKFKPGIDCRFSFEGSGNNRKLVAELVGDSISTNEKSALNNFLKGKFGSNKAEIL